MLPELLVVIVVQVVRERRVERHGRGRFRAAVDICGGVGGTEVAGVVLVIEMVEMVASGKR